MAAAVLGLGHHLPPLVERGGVRRPIAVEPVGPSELAVPAVRSALGRAGLTESDVDFVIFATMTPDVTFPGAACFLQRQLDLGTVGALDVRGQCAGFLYALAIAEDFIACGVYSRVLVIGAEIHSSGLDYDGPGRPTALLFGDGAAAAILGPGSESGGVRSVAIGCEGKEHQRFWCEYPASRQHPVRFTLENFRAGQHFPSIDLDAVQTHAMVQLPQAINQALGKANVDLESVDCFIVSHLLPEVAEAAASSLGIPKSRLLVPSAQHGHLTAAALPLALSEAVDRGQLAAGATVCLAAAGAGLSWGSAVVVL